MSVSAPRKVRFAPSPTGRLHIGNIRTALYNWLYAHQAGGGQFLLRLDDTDAERSREEFAEGIREDLRWLGLNWDREARQSERISRYQEIVAKLKQQGRLYPCYETAEELERKRKRLAARGKPPIYDRAGLFLTEAEKRALEAEGRKPHWRFLLDNFTDDPRQIERRDICWTDLVRGEQRVDIGSLSDPVLIRADGSYLYTLPSVVDDIDFGITDIIRGEDHVANTAVQIDLFAALGAEAPNFGHHNLLTGADGRALSKRLGALAVASFRERGFEPLAVVSHAATIGTSDPVAPFSDMAALAANFSFAKLSRAPARFDEKELAAVNARLLHELPYEAVEARLAEIGVAPERAAAFWEAVRPNLHVFEDVKPWWDIVRGAFAPVIEDRDFVATAAQLLPPEPWDEQTWAVWTAAIKAQTGRKGKALFRPLRLALTGREQGPELKKLLPLIGREKAHARLAGQPSNDEIAKAV